MRCACLGLRHSLYFHHFYVCHMTGLEKVPFLKSLVWLEVNWVLCYSRRRGVLSVYEVILLTKLWPGLRLWANVMNDLDGFNIYFWLRFGFCYQNFLKITFKTGFWVQILLYLLNLFSSVVNSQRLCCQKAGVKCLY